MLLPVIFEKLMQPCESVSMLKLVANLRLAVMAVINGLHPQYLKSVVKA
jgi:hypothetical protein